LPTDGSPVYVRLWSLVGATWFFRDYTYTASTVALPSLAINNTSVTEGDSGTTTATFTVTLTPTSTQTVTVAYSTAAGTAGAPSDYLIATGTLTFAPGVSTRTIGVTVNGDTTIEPNETFVMNLTSPTNATISDAQGTATIVNDDAVQPALSINNVSVTEGNSGTTTATFTVTLTPASTQTVTVAYATADATATTAGLDYVAKTGTLTFAAGATTQTIVVTTNGDTTIEADETFAVNLTGPTNATIADAQGVGTIVNDDLALSALSINNVGVTEANSGTTTATFTVTLTPVSTQSVTVAYATADGTATTAGSDYVAKSGTLTFAPGVTTQTIAVTVNGDTTFEPDETFVVNLTSPTNATISDAQGVGTLVNNDAPSVLSINDVSVTEGNSATATATFTVTLTGTTTQTVTVAYATADGTATTANGDYVPKSGTLTFAPGTTTQTIAVTVNGDTTI
jgi:large repetitive protein